MLTLQQIIDEAGVLVPNQNNPADKVVWLNAINADFFNAVKIPVILKFTSTIGQADYALSSVVREKNIDLVNVGLIKYRSLDTDSVYPLQNAYNFDDTNLTLTLSPAPYQTGLQGILRHRRIATTTFLASGLGVSPDVPEEYQWTFIPALAAYLANSQDDMVKASNYENQCKNAWNLAAQDYAKKSEQP